MKNWRPESDEGMRKDIRLTYTRATMKKMLTDADELEVRLRILNRELSALVLDHLLPVRTHPGSPRSQFPQVCLNSSRPDTRGIITTEEDLR